MADKRLLTDRYLRALPPAPQGPARRGVGRRVFPASASGSPTPRTPTRRGAARPGGSLSCCTPGSSGAAPTRRTIGTYGAITLEEARHTAGEWRCLIAKGIDPAVIEAEAREKAERERARASSIHSPSPPRRSSPTS